MTPALSDGRIIVLSNRVNHMLNNTFMKAQTTRTAAVLLLSLMMLVEVSGQEKERRVNLAGDWHFTLGDNKKFAKPEFDDTDWEEIYVPSEWQREGFRNYHGYAWYRKKVTIEVESKDALYLELGKIDDVDEVFVHDGSRCRVFERLVRHHVTPMTRRVANRQQNRLSFRARLTERIG